jgi:hypothetical protein
MIDWSASVEVHPAVVADIEGAWHCPDVVAREKAYLSFLEAPPLEDAVPASDGGCSSLPWN